ncbi:hypothetical protein [Aureimonas ureilytica]|nr:hypothetical protein [Aureimonas ureilytica]
MGDRGTRGARSFVSPSGRARRAAPVAVSILAAMPPRPTVLPSLLVALALLLAVGAAEAVPSGAWDLRGSLPLEMAAHGGAASTLSGWSLPPVELRSLLRMVHLIGLCLGLGTTLLLDGNLLGWMRAGRAPDYAPSILGAGRRVVMVGFGLLWASGAALTALAVSSDPSFLASPKLWAKIVVVTALTANAFVLHTRVLSPFSQSLARAIDGRWRGRERRLFVACGAVSATSWLVAFALGVLREWNQGAGFGAILLVWLIGMLAAALAIRLLLPAPSAAAPYRGPDRRQRSAV